MADFVLSIRRFLLLIIQLAIITTYVNSSNYLFTSNCSPENDLHGIVGHRISFFTTTRKKSHKRNKNTKDEKLKIIVSIVKIF